MEAVSLGGHRAQARSPGELPTHLRLSLGCEIGAMPPTSKATSGPRKTHLLYGKRAKYSIVCDNL